MNKVAPHNVRRHRIEKVKRDVVLWILVLTFLIPCGRVGYVGGVTPDVMWSGWSV